MKFLKTILKSTLASRHFHVLMCMVIVLSFNSCNDTSDTIVDETIPDQQFNVEELIEVLHIDSLNFIEDVVLVEGNIKEINHLNNRNTIILSSHLNSDTAIICDMQKDQAKLLDSLEVGQDISIKGILKGSLKDVILLNCKISNLTH